jgi:uncharacterized lipoprotein YmbA
MNARLLPLLCGLLLAGCSILAPLPDASRFYTLTAVESGGAPDPLRGVVVGVGPVHLPAYLERSEIVTRVAPNQVEFSSVARWADPLTRSFVSILREDLARILAPDRVVAFPWFDATGVTYGIEITVDRFEATADGNVDFWAHWMLRAGATRAPLDGGDFRKSVPVPGRTTEAAVAEQSKLVAELAEMLATAVRHVATRDHVSGRDGR